MSELFIKIACIVIVIDIIYLIIPGEKYGNYCKMVVGIITLLAVLNLFTNSDFSLNFNEMENEYLVNYNMQDKFDNLVKEDLNEKILNYLKNKEYGKVINYVECQYYGNIINEITIGIDGECNKDKLADDTATFCSINKEKVMIEHI